MMVRNSKYFITITLSFKGLPALQDNIFPAEGIVLNQETAITNNHARR